MSVDVDDCAIRSWRASLLGMMAVFGLMATVLLAPGRSEGRLQPYYVVNSVTTPLSIKPRILFVLDTSGSMAWKAQASAQACEWDDCENAEGTVNESRISAARRTIREVVTATETASFGLMTFDLFGARTDSSTPATCYDGERFVWVNEYYPYVGGWKWISRDSGLTGAWHLCQGSYVQPYPYLRWDDLGVGSEITANTQTGDVPDSPLISTSSGSFNSTSNQYRKVQWFDEFLGTRFQANATTDPDRSISRASSGDYGGTNTTIDANVYGHDFYYWPYVDGFPGYSQFLVYPYDNGADYAGVADSATWITGATLYAPFYLDLSSSGISSDNWGPASDDDATEEVLARTQPLIEGGVDASSGTPWASAIGTIPTTPTQSNAKESHTSVASYLKFVSENATADACAPTAAVLITDGEPSSGEGGSLLYGRLANLRDELGIKVYVVGFFLGSGGELNNMACAGAGACAGTCSSPCDDTPAADWDTCADEDDPENTCAYVSNSTDELRDALTGIVARATELDAPSGPGASIADFGVGADGAPGEGAIVQTSLAGWTEYPAWKGHIARQVCTDRDAEGKLLPECETPSPEFDDGDIEETFGPCEQSRDWDAGECLQRTAWTDRRLYTHSSDNQLIALIESDGTATDAFVAELKLHGLLSSGDEQAEANEYAAFLLGRDAPDGWKLPGLASAAPLIVRRVPKYRASQLPEVAIRDPHCAGRPYGASDGGQLPDSLYTFAKSAWEEQIDSPSTHYEYQEAVIVGDDFGVLHAFQLNSGNELWGLVPRTLLSNLPDYVANGAAARGQPSELDDHIYGIAATANVAWAYDDTSADERDHTWRHLAVIGLGAGGSEYMALDLSHMSPYSSRDPVEILWTTSTSPDEAYFTRGLGETWSRPALAFHVPSEDIAKEPDPFVVMASGYAEEGVGTDLPGRVVYKVDAITGEVDEYSIFSAPTTKQYESSYGLVGDPAVTSHCRSRFWAEAQEAYFADPAGRLFRWDLGRDSDHEADSGGRWGTSAQPLTDDPFYACGGSGSTCSISSSYGTDPFLFAPAVSSIDRIESSSDAASGTPAPATDEFLVALISGSVDDDSLPGEFHTSLYLMVDQHGDGLESAGLSIPKGGGKTSPGTDAAFMRQAVTDISRTRTFTPYPGAGEVVETEAFSSETRALRAPRIRVSGVVDAEGASIDDVEVYEIEYTLYEPPSAECNPLFYDSSTGEWHLDPGSTFRIVYGLTADVASGFDLINGAGDTVADFGDDYSTGLTLARVEQVTPSGCEDGLCGASQDGPKFSPCDNNEEGASTESDKSFAVPVSAKQVLGFTPYE